MTDLGDKLAALGLGALKIKKAIPQPEVQKKTNAPNGDFADMEAAMARKLAENGPYSKVPSNSEAVSPGAAERKPAKAVAGMSGRRARAPVTEGPTSAGDSGVASRPKVRLTRAAQERLRYEPISNADPEPDIRVEAGPQDETAPPSIIVGVTADVDQPGGEELPDAEAAELVFHSYEHAFQYIVALVGESTPEIEDRPASLPVENIAQLDRRIESGARWLRDHPDADEDGYVVGFDFGTSSVKMVVREPYRAGNETAALPAPLELRSLGHPYLWQTAVWFDPAASRFSLYPVPGAKVLEGFKTGIVGGNGKEAVWTDPEVSRSEAATAFIALHLCNLMGWYEEEKPLKRSTASNYLKINIGVPVATQDNPAALAPFEEVVCAAVELSRACEPVTLKNVKDSLAISRREKVPQGFGLVPELSAALVGYALDPTSPLGAHVLIDVGASTLDVVAFNLIDQEGMPEIKAFAASVELLGAAALDVATRHEINDADFSKACNHQFGHTYGVACDVAPRSFSLKNNPDRPDVRLVITGGGCGTAVHAGMIAELPDRILGGQSGARPQPPLSIASMACDRSRLLLAYGLAHDDPDIPYPTLPSDIPPIPRRPADTGPSIIGPEQM